MAHPRLTYRQREMGEVERYCRPARPVGRCGKTGLASTAGRLQAGTSGWRSVYKRACGCRSASRSARVDGPAAAPRTLSIYSAIRTRQEKAARVSRRKKETNGCSYCKPEAAEWACTTYSEACVRACVCSVVYALARWLHFVCIWRVHAESTLPWEWRNHV